MHNQEPVIRQQKAILLAVGSALQLIIAIYGLIKFALRSNSGLEILFPTVFFFALGIFGLRLYVYGEGRRAVDWTNLLLVCIFEWFFIYAFKAWFVSGDAIFIIDIIVQFIATLIPLMCLIGATGIGKQAKSNQGQASAQPLQPPRQSEQSPVLPPKLSAPHAVTDAEGRGVAKAKLKYKIDTASGTVYCESIDEICAALGSGKVAASDIIWRDEDRIGSLSDLLKSRKPADPTPPTPPHAPPVGTRDETHSFFTAEWDADLAKVKAVLQDNPGLILSKDNEGMTPMHWAALNGHGDVAEFLFSRGADINARSNDGSMPIHWAAAEGHEDVVKLLIAKGTDANAKDKDGWTPIHWAAFNGHKNVAAFLLNNQADANAKANDGSTPIHRATAKGYKDMVELLIANGSGVNAKDKNSQTPMHWAAAEGNKIMAALLLAKGANVDAKDNDGWTPLHWAALNGHKDVAKLLLTNKADISAKASDGSTPLHWAVENKHNDMAELLQAKEASATPTPNSQTASTTTQVQFKRERRNQHPVFPDVQTVTKTYSAPNRDAAVKFLRQQHITESFLYIEVVTPQGLFGIDNMGEIYDSGGAFPGDSSELLDKPMPTTRPDATQLDSPEWQTLSESFHNATHGGNLDKVKIMLNDNPNLLFSRAASFGQASLHAAAGEGHKEVVELLLAKGADVNVRDQNHQTPLHYAAVNNHKDVVALLLAKGADANAMMHMGLTPLHSAASQGHKDVVELLLAKGDTVNARTENDGQTPLHKAATKDIAELLLANGADVNEKSRDGWSPLHTAAAHGYIGVVELLLAKGAMINAKNDSGDTPLRCAMRTKQNNVAELIRVRGGHE